MRYLDAHCHLNEEHIFGHREECLQRFVDVGGAGIVNVGANDFYNHKGIEIAKHVSLCKATVGLHPEEIEKIQGEDVERLKEMIIQNKEYVVAVGECGIDLHFPGAEESLGKQKELFAQQCELARDMKLPLVVHSRDAFDQTLDVLKNYKDLVVYFHCRGYGPEEIGRLFKSPQPPFVKGGPFIGFCGNVTYGKADALRESLKLVPLDQLLLETDAPYLAPQIVRGQENEPMNVKYIYEFVAGFLGVDQEVLAEQLEKNFHKLYIK